MALDGISGPSALHGECILHFGFVFTFLPRLGSKTPICSSGAWLEEEMFCTAPAWALPNWAGKGLDGSRAAFWAVGLCAGPLIRNWVCCEIIRDSHLGIITNINEQIS